MGCCFLYYNTSFILLYFAASYTTVLFTYLVTGTWELQAKEVSCKSKGKEFGVIRLKREALLKGMKLEHISGDLTCSIQLTRKKLKGL